MIKQYQKKKLVFLIANYFSLHTEVQIIELALPKYHFICFEEFVKMMVNFIKRLEDTFSNNSRIKNKDFPYAS